MNDPGQANERTRNDGVIARAFAVASEPAYGLAARVVDFVRQAEADRDRRPPLDVVASDRGIREIRFGRGTTHAPGPAARRHAEQARAEIDEFFAALRGYFTVPLDLATTRPFQRAVLAAAARIPLGEVRSYRWVAVQAGSASAVRAVGTALRTNPVPLLVPCHRVIRSDGSLGGYAGGPGLKHRLLTLERTIPGLVGLVPQRRVCRVGCPEERGRPEVDRVVFSSIASARGSGYRPCPHCRPEAGADR